MHCTIIACFNLFFVPIWWIIIIKTISDATEITETQVFRRAGVKKSSHNWWIHPRTDWGLLVRDSGALRCIGYKYRIDQVRCARIAPCHRSLSVSFGCSSSSATGCWSRRVLPASRTMRRGADLLSHRLMWLLVASSTLCFAGMSVFLPFAKKDM